MAAVKLKSNENSCTKPFTEHNNENIPEELTFRIYDAFLIVLSMGTFLVDLSTDAILVVEYFENGHFYWAVSTLLIIVLPAVIVQVFSMRWHIMDESTGLLHWVAHVFLLGLIHRYVVALKTGFEARTSGDPLDFQRLYHQQNDICMLRLFESFMESAPQLVLQLYIMISLEDWRSWTGVSAVASLASLAWAVAAYTKAMRRARPDKCSLSAVGFLLQALWRGSMITARITALVLFAVGFRAWLFLLLGVHWIGMTAWIMFQHTDFCQSPWEEKIYNCVVGVIYCFCFFNLKEGRSRMRMLVFYTVIVLQNISCLGMFIGFTGMTRFNLVIFGTTAVGGGTILGIMSMLLYYGFFHPAGHIKFHSETVNHDEHETQMSTMKSENTATIRSLKHCWDLYKEQPAGRINNMPSNGGSPLSDDATADKNLLLNNWAPCQTATPTEFLNLGLEISDEIETVKATEEPRTQTSTTKYDALKQKRRGICSPEELGIDIGHPLEDISSLEDIATTTDANHLQRPSFSAIHEIGIEAAIADGKNAVILDEMTRQKRRAICSPIDFDVFSGAHDIENNKEENILSMSVADASAESSTEILCEQFPGTVTEKKCETEPCNVNQQDVQPGGSEDAPSEILSVPSEVLSAHDYENICAVNIAREAWGLRSWRGYSDIETWLHDDSVVRDRRRDTLTSTVTTITSASSDNSTTSGEPLAVTISPPPIPCRRPNVGIRVQRSRQDDYLDTLVDDLAECERNQNLPDFVSEQDSEFSVFIARPYVIDQNGAFHPVTTLDTIMEEHEESSTEAGDSIKLRRRHDSASTLVATIDEIRRGSSLCNLYNSTWDSRSCSSASTLNGSPQKSPSKNKFPFDSIYSTSLPSLPSSSLSTHPYSSVTRDSLLLSKLQDALNDDCRLSSKMVSSTMSHGPEIVLDAMSYLSSDSVPEHSTHQQASCSEAKKSGKPNRIRRKFSLLREKFEHKETVRDASQQLEVYASEDGKSYAEPSPEYCATVKNDIVLDTSTGKMEEPSDKENVIPAVTSRIKQWNSILKSQNSDQRLHIEASNPSGEIEREISKPVKVGYVNLKERRSVFLKQVLSPPRFQSKPKRTNLSAAWKGVYVS